MAVKPAAALTSLRHLPWWAWLLIAAGGAVVVYLIWRQYSGASSSATLPSQTPSPFSVGPAQGATVTQVPAPVTRGAQGTSGGAPRTGAPAPQTPATGAQTGGIAPAVSSLAARTAGPTAPTLVRQQYALGSVHGVPVIYHNRSELLAGSYVAPPAGSGPQYAISASVLEKAIGLQKQAYARAAAAGNTAGMSAAHLRASEARQQLRIMGVNIPTALQN